MCTVGLGLGSEITTCTGRFVGQYDPNPLVRTANMAKIFISYNRQSEAIAKTLVEDIDAMGHTVWFDQELSGGQVWWDRILASIRECDVLAFLLDTKSLSSTACQREYVYAADLGKSVLPILVADDVSTNLLPPQLSQLQFVDYRKSDRGAALRLARALTSIPAAKPLPSPLPAPPPVPLSSLGGLGEQIARTSSLTFEEQSALVLDLKRSLRVPETKNDARTLLLSLRKRRDLLATIAKEIDELLGPNHVRKMPLPATSLKPCPWRIPAQAAVGVWYNPRQCVCHR
jgi:hypothetical protein